MPSNLLDYVMGLLIHLFLICERYRSTHDYIFVPNCLFNEIYSAKTFDLRSVENTSDHLPIKIKLNQSKIPDCAKILKEEYLTWV